MNVTELPFPSHEYDRPEHGESHPAVLVLRTTYLMLTSVLIIAANILCILVTKKSSTMEDATKIFTTSLAITDLSIGVVSTPSIVSSASDSWPYGTAMCQLINELYTTLCSLSLIILTCLGLDRLQAIQKPLQYNQIMTKKKAQITVIIAWLLVIAYYIVINPYSGFSEFPSEYRREIGSCSYSFTMLRTEDIDMVILGILIFYALPVTIMTSVYIKLMVVSRAQIKRIRKQVPMGPKPRLQGSILMFSFAMLASLLVWTPIMLLILYECLMKQRTAPLVEFVLYWLPISNSWWNVLLYAWSNRTWRETCVLMLRKWFTKPRIEPTVAYIT